MATQKERKALRNSTSKDPKGTFSLQKIAHHTMKKMTMPNERVLFMAKNNKQKVSNKEEEGCTIEELYEEAIKLIKYLKAEKIYSNTLEEQVQGLKIEFE